MAAADSDSDSEWSFIKYLADDLSAVPRASDYSECLVHARSLTQICPSPRHPAESTAQRCTVSGGARRCRTFRGCGGPACSVFDPLREHETMQVARWLDQSSAIDSVGVLCQLL